MQKFNWIHTILIMILIFGVTTLVYLYSAGFRLERSKRNEINFKKTGMVSAKSIPEGASVYIDALLLTATNDTIAGIEPGKRHLKIERRGFVPWEKDIEVFEELVTDITAVLVTQSPRLDPLTNTGATFPNISPSLFKLAYFSKDEGTPGVMIMPTGGVIEMLRSTPSAAVKDTKARKYSDGKSIEWSPDEKELLIEGITKRFYLVNLETNVEQIMDSPDTVRKQWADKLLKKRQAFVEKLVELPEDIKTVALSDKAIWAPDEKKFLYINQNGDNLEYKVYNLEKPIPVGEKMENIVFTTNRNATQPKTNWYSDSFHLILVEGNVANDKKGTISIIRIDGSNRTEVYNNTLYSDQVFSAPGGDKLIILTSFKSGDQTDLYTVSLR